MQAPIPSATLRLTGAYPGYTTSDNIGAFPEAPLFLRDQRLWLVELARTLNNTIKGKLNNTGRVTLATNAATTTVSLRAGLIGKDTLVVLVPMTSTAATEFGAGSIYVSDVDVTNAQFTITHVNSATAGRKFGFILMG